MKLQIMLELPPAPEQTEKAVCGPSIEEQVKDALECINSGYDSAADWSMINKLYKALCTAKPNPRIQNLIAMIKPVLAKFGYHGVSNEG